MVNSQWKFRGREAEQEWLRNFLDDSYFRSMRVLGRRRIGKTRLLLEVMTQQRNGAGPAVMIDLSEAVRDDEVSGGSTLPSSEEKTGKAVIQMSQAAREAGLPYEIDQSLEYNSFRFRKLLQKLIDCRATVVLDEFQHARPLGIEGAVKAMIDHYRNATGRRSSDGNRCGKLIITGSHRQRLFEMFRDDQMLFDRFDESMHLNPWSLKTVLDVAAEEDLLDWPDRLLTLYTAFGGMPGAWEQFVSRRHPSCDLAAWPNSRDWQLAFIEDQRALLTQDPENRWDHAAFVQLSARNRAVLDVIARRSGGATPSEINGILKVRDRSAELKLGMERRDVELALNALHEHMEFIAKSWNPEDNKDQNPVWRVTDLPALFQILVMGDTDLSKEEEDLRSARHNRLENHEGTVLEQLSNAWLKDMDTITWRGTNLRRSRQSMESDNPDVDVMAVHRVGHVKTLIMAGCKRNAGKHEPAKLTRQFDQFFDAVKVKQSWEDMTRRRLLISPRFTPALRDQYAGSGYECVDILDMARSLGIAWEPARSRTRPGPDPSVPSDAEIRAARAQRTQHQIAVVDFNRARTRLEREEQGYLEDQSRLETQRAATGLFAWGRKRDLRAAMARAQDAAAAARTAIESLEEPAALDPDVRTRARTPTQAEHQQQTARAAVRALEAEARFFARQRDPESAGPRDHPPDRSCIFVVAKPGHVPPEDTEIAVRHWHHFAIWQPVHGAEELRMLSAAFPDSVLAPAPEVRSVWPFSQPQPDGPQADASLQSWGVTDHIDRVEGRDDGGNGSPPPPPRRPDPEPSSGHEP